MKRNSVLFSALLLFCAFLTACRQSVPALVEPAEGAGREGHTFAEPHRITICVDAGHGFDDIGTSSPYLDDLAEKDITLDIVLQLRDFLEEKGFNVLLTHDGSVFPKTVLDDGNNLFNPKERIAYADTLDIDYYISIHCDSYEADSSVRGTRVYYSQGTPYTKKSARAADDICAALNTAFPDDKKCISKDMAMDKAYYVIREAKVPSALIEIGFVTNPDDAKKMCSEAWRDSFASAVADGIALFFTE